MLCFGIESQSKKLKKKCNTGSTYLDCFLVALLNRCRSFAPAAQLICNSKEGSALITLAPNESPIVIASGPRGKTLISYASLDPSGKINKKTCEVDRDTVLETVYKDMRLLLKSYRKKSQPDAIQKSAGSNKTSSEPPLDWFSQLIQVVYEGIARDYAVEIRLEPPGASVIYPIKKRHPIIALNQDPQSKKASIVVWGCDYQGNVKSAVANKLDANQVNRFISLARQRARFLNVPQRSPDIISTAPHTNDSLPPCSPVKIEDSALGKAELTSFFLPIVVSNGEVRNTRARYPAYFEKGHGGVYHLSKYSFERASKEGHVLLRDISKQAKHKKGQSFEDYQTESALKQLGYSVAQNVPLTQKQRQSILLYAAKRGVMKPDRIQSFLGWLIRTHPQDMYETARARWEQDISFAKRI